MEDDAESPDLPNDAATPTTDSRVPEADNATPASPDHEEESSSRTPSPTPLYDDPSDEDDGEGEWITPSNVATHKSKAVGILPSVDGKSKRKSEAIGAGCMSADFAVQNVLLQMGLSLVGTEGKRIVRLKTWVLRCHACFKYVALLRGACLLT